MKRIFSSRTFNTFQLELETWPYPEHTHNFYEIILINQGKGQHILNDSTVPYEENSVFLLTPDDYHAFQIQDPTTFTYIKFTEQLFREKHFSTYDNQWIKKVENALYKPNTISENLVIDPNDNTLLFTLSKALLQEFKSPKRYSRNLLLELFGAVLIILIRNLEKKNPPTSNTVYIEQQKLQAVLAHIRQHLNDKTLVTQKYIGTTFNISPNYLSKYLKKHTGLGLQKILTETRLKTAERLLLQSGLTISEIAIRVGFTDASHMNKIFQKYRERNPSSYRK